MASTSERLEKVRAAIDALIDGGVSQYSIGSRSVTKLDLPELMAMEEKLIERLERETGSGSFTLGRMNRHRR